MYKIKELHYKLYYELHIPILLTTYETKIDEMRNEVGTE